MEFSAEDKMHIDSIALRRMVDLISDDEGAAEVIRENPDECARIFLAGCQAGVTALGNLLDRKVFKSK